MLISQAALERLWNPNITDQDRQAAQQSAAIE